MKYWLRYVPLARVLSGLTAGVFCADVLTIPTSVSVAAITTLLTINLFLLLHPSYRWGWISGITVMVISFLFGNTYTNLRSTSMLPTDEPDAVVSGYASNIAGFTGKAMKVDFVADIIYTANNKWVNQKGIVYINKDASKGIEPGTQLSFSMRLMPAKAPTNPGMFDYQRYLRLNGYSFTGFADTATITRGSQSKKSIKVLTSRLKEGIMSTFISNGIDSTGLGLLQSLFLGDKSDMDQQTKQAFMNSGTMHLLAVSGLHVGIIYLIISSIFPASKKRRLKTLRFIYILLFLWFYAVVTGLSPSVLRAVIMMTVIEAGRTFTRELSMTNLLTVSLFIILIINPLAVYSAGLWLSYSAVAGIVWIFPIINNLFYFRFPFFNWLWAMTSVSVAAQIGTIPFTLFYFHNFPVYFLINNLIMVPLLAPVLSLAIICLIVSPLPFLAQMTAGVLNDLLRFMENYVIFSEEMPNSLIRHIPFDGFDLAISIIMLFMIFFFINYRSFRTLNVALALLSVFLIKQLAYNRLMAGREEITVFDVPSGTLMTIVTPRKSIIIASDNLSDNNIYFAVSGYLSKAGAGRAEIVRISKAAIARSGIWSACITTGNTSTPTDTTSLLIVAATQKPEPATEMIPTSQIVLLPGMKPFVKDKWEKLAKNSSAELWDISTLGAYTLKMNRQHIKKK